MSTRPRKTRKDRPLGLAATIIAAVLIGIFVALAVGPVVHLAARALPVTETIVTVVDRSYTESQGGYPFRVRFGDSRFSYYVTVRYPSGATRRISAPRELYDAALPGLTTLATIRLEESVLFGVPVALTMTGLSGVEPERVELLIPIVGTLIGGVFALGIAGYLLRLLLRRRGVNYPALSIILVASAGLGGWFWL